MTTALVACPGCGTRYDLSRRAPGRKVRCPRCQAVLVVPAEPEPAAAASPEVTASARLRRARGPTCRWHPKRTADERCPGCRSFTCEACWAPAPADHLCAACAADRGLGAALAVDFGPLATPRLALVALARSLLTILAWNAASIAGTLLVFAGPIVGGLTVFRAVPAGDWRADLAAGVVLGGVIGALVFHYLLLMPSGCAVFLDHAVRGVRPGFAAAMGEAWRRALRNAGSLLGVLLALGLLILPFAVIVLGAVYLLYSGASDDAGRAAAALLLLAAIPLVVFPVVTALGLAVPVVVLEERPAAAALARAWELVRPQLHVVALLVVGYFALQAGVTTLIGATTTRLGLPKVTFLLAHLTDLVWPALLVAAYHGLVAEQVGVPGRK